MTLDMILAVQYIIGQLNGPLDQMIDFLRQSQGARLSIDRLALLTSPLPIPPGMKS